MNSKQGHQNFTELTVWQVSRKLKNDIFNLVKVFPPEEKFRLTDQLIRSSRSIGANIAEGHGRFTYKDQLRFCIQARGSLTETLNHLFDAMDCGYIEKEVIVDFQHQIDETGKLLNGYITYLKNNVNND